MLQLGWHHGNKSSRPLFIQGTRGLFLFLHKIRNYYQQLLLFILHW
jgi:hypothetical protein